MNGIKRALLIFSSAIFALPSAMGQAPSENPNYNPPKGFNKFREEIFDNFNKFKSRILDHYQDFLDGEWHEFEPMDEMKSPYTEQKPESMPEFVEVGSQDTDMAVSFVAETKAGGLSLAGLPLSSSYSRYTTPGDKFFNSDAAGKNPLLASKTDKLSNFEIAAYGLDDPEFFFGNLPGQRHLPDVQDGGIVNFDDSVPNAKDKFAFDFYGMKAYIPDVQFDILPDFEGFRDTGAHWGMMASQGAGEETARQLFGLARKTGLNGYLTYRLTEAFVNQRFADAHQGSRMSAVHFLLSNMGYDVRLLMINDLLAIMMPFDQKIVYCSMYLDENNGRRYTIIYPDGFERTSGEPISVRTCAMPSEAVGKTSDLRVTGLNLPVKSKNFTLKNHNLELSGVVNENLKKMFYHYPQMPNGDFASSWLDAGLRESLVAQVKQQLGGVDKNDAVNTLMSLCHYAFPYKSDQAWHIFEKPYFIEENFLYEFNDCEDRAMFLSFLVWNAFGIPCQLIQYPGHESVAVAVDEQLARGRYYNTEGMKFFSADPTYKGSRIGHVMPRYQETVPTIDKLYK